MVDSSSPAALVPPILGAIVLIIGTASVVYINAKKRQEARRQKLQTTKTDEENGMQDVAVNSDVPRNDDSISDPPLLLPTVSAATSDFGSLTYNLFVLTAVIHGTCLILTGLLQRDVTKRFDSSFASTMGTLLVIGAAVAAAGILLTSMIPARGRGTIPHITFGFIFFEAAIVWMIWTCMVTRTIGGSIALLVIRIVLASLACIATMSASKSTTKTMKLRNKEGVEEEWFQLMHRTAICQLSFGFLYGIFFATVAADFNQQ